VLPLALALTSSLFWGFADFIGGVKARQLALVQVILVGEVVGLPLLAVAIAAAGDAPPRLARLIPAAVAGTAGVIGLAAFYRGLAIGKMSIVAPIAATGVCVPVIVGIANGERPTALQLAGIFAATGGVVLASRERAEGHDSTSARTARVSVVLALIAALGFGAYAVGLRSSARADVLWAVFASRVPGVALLTLAYLIRRPAQRMGRTGAATLVLMGLLDVSANGLYALAFRHGLLSIVAVAASLYPLVTVILARTVLRERVHRVQEVGVAAALAGVVMIAAG
jgi:drug/metabolite transporter (DMT)-like permease